MSDWTPPPNPLADRPWQPDEMWTDVCSPNSGDYLERIAVPGGWLYRTVVTKGRDPRLLGVAMCFVPDAPAVEPAKPA